jgi:hypothetical protein
MLNVGCSMLRFAMQDTVGVLTYNKCLRSYSNLNLNLTLLAPPALVAAMPPYAFPGKKSFFFIRENQC